MGGAGALLLWRGGADWSVALLAGAGAATFALWRTIAGTWVAFAFVLLAAIAVQPFAPLLRLGPVLGPLVALEGAGWLSIVLAAQWGSGYVSRRLLGAWLASTSLVVLGASLLSRGETAGTGAALLGAALAYKLGIVPMFAWAPLLLRNNALKVERLGIAAFAMASAVLWFALPRLGEDSARRAVVLLSLVTAPWALYHVRRQWRLDRRCARSYAAVLGAALASLVHFWLT